MQYYVKVFIKRKTGSPILTTLAETDFQDAREDLEIWANMADCLVESPFYVLHIFPVAKGNQKAVFTVSFDAKTDQKAV